LNFIESKKPNPNFLETIIKLSNFSPEVKLKAKKKYNKITNAFFENNNNNTSSI